MIPPRLGEVGYGIHVHCCTTKADGVKTTLWEVDFPHCVIITRSKGDDLIGLFHRRILTLHQHMDFTLKNCSYAG